MSRRRGLWSVVGGGILVALAASLPWSSPPVVYETVSGWPMRVYYRNVGNGPERLSAVGGLPAYSVDEPLPPKQIDAYFVKIKKKLSLASTLIRSGDVAWFEIDDPDRLAWESDKIAPRPSWFYVFAIVELPRGSLVNRKWVSELCLVAKTHEEFKKCPQHNGVYSDS